MSSIYLRCCENKSLFEIEYEIGTTYLVCSKCFEMKHFARGIKSKTDVGNSLTTQPTSKNTSNDRRYSK